MKIKLENVLTGNIPDNSAMLVQHNEVQCRKKTNIQIRT